ncbi:DUF871 domain-containing protein [Enterococcus ratti]|uniref:Outer surface protein n=1 Tax=Enterococcus ratti TaxID=150033 RepID=A0A1L8WLC4_9ENTE|nr:MupG family TIM beta-alpha barrel fold protein [Enterococcus ratti]OJG81825.1 hypothetical protein RV14_GL002368 [Enterococcus ratti]
MFGFSVFLNQSFNTDKKEYIRKMANRGFKGIFTSLQIPEENSKTYKKYLTFLGEQARINHLDLMVDVSLKSLEKAGFSLADLKSIKSLGVTGLRIDEGIENRKIAELSKYMRVGLNASTITQQDVNELKNYQANFTKLEAWHNYYPRPETGVSQEFFQEKTTWLKNLGLKTVAFVPGDQNLRQPLFEGLPTLEKHRYQLPLASALELFSMRIDSVYIGDEGLETKSLQQFKVYAKSHRILLYATVLPRYEQWVLRTHVNRKDVARDVFRSEQARLWNLPTIVPENCVERIIGSITLDNERYGRYMGELQITKTNLPANKKVNVVGKIREKDCILLNYLNSAQKIEIQNN